VEHVITEHPALAKFRDMKCSFNADNLIDFSVRDGYASDVASAQGYLDGVLQWLACHAVKEHAEQPYVMMKGPVDQMYHALMLNTRLYLHFCRDYIGFFIHHTPVDDKQANEIKLAGGINYTIGFLQKAFGTKLSPALREWIRTHERGELNASSVSCIGNDVDNTPDKLLGITDFRSFWDRNPEFVGTA